MFKALANGIKLGKVWDGRGIYKLFLLLWNMRKRGQFQIAFGMIFSIILIVAFIVVAIIAINTFLGVSCSIETGSFINDLDNEINRIYKGAGESTTKEFKINGCDFEYVCFYDVDSDANGEYANFISDLKISTGDEGDHNL